MRNDIEAALAAWRDAERRLQNANDGDRAALEADVARHRDEFQRLSGEYVIERIDAFEDAEARRQTATPSTKPFHDAAREEAAIAAELWEVARVSDEDVPRSN